MTTYGANCHRASLAGKRSSTGILKYRHDPNPKTTVRTSAASRSLFIHCVLMSLIIAGLAINELGYGRAYSPGLPNPPLINHEYAEY